MDNNLPVFELVISPDDDKSGVTFVSLVEQPATEYDFQAFSRQENLKFNIDSEEKRVISGPLMVANLAIPRHDETFGAHFVVFGAETIRAIALKFFRSGLTDAVNTDHRNEIDKGVYMFESFFIDSARGIPTPKGFEPLPDGSWFGSYKVDNDEIWAKVKAGEFKGFSVEGFFKYAGQLPVKDKEQALLEEIMEVLQSIN